MNKLLRLNLILLSLALLIFTPACKKSKTDEEVITAFIAKKGWTAQSTPEGVYYVIDTLGTGTAYPTGESYPYTKYKGYLADETVFDSGTLNIPNDARTRVKLQNLIIGWQIGMAKFKKGGKGKLLIPSAYGYGSTSQPGIPANSVTIFDIELLNF